MQWLEHHGSLTNPDAAKRGSDNQESGKNRECQIFVRRISKTVLKKQLTTYPVAPWHTALPLPSHVAHSIRAESRATGSGARFYADAVLFGFTFAIKVDTLKIHGVKHGWSVSLVVREDGMRGSFKIHASLYKDFRFPRKKSGSSKINEENFWRVSRCIWLTFRKTTRENTLPLRREPTLLGPERYPVEKAGISRDGESSSRPRPTGCRSGRSRSD